METEDFEFCFAKNNLLQNFIRDFTKPLNMTELSKNYFLKQK